MEKDTTLIKSTDRKAIITIYARQQNGDDEETMEMITDGHYRVERGEAGEIYTAIYEESEITGMEGTTTVVEIVGKRVTLTRRGGVQTMMCFEKDTKNYSYYDTGYGSFAVGVHTFEMQGEMTAEGGALHVSYSVEIDHALTGVNTFDIKVRLAS